MEDKCNEIKDYQQKVSNAKKNMSNRSSSYENNITPLDFETAKFFQDNIHQKESFNLKSLNK